MANLNIGASLATVNTLAGLPVDKETIYATLSAPSDLSLSEPMHQGQTMEIVINPTANIILPMPTTTGWYTTFGDTLPLIKEAKTILTITCIGNGQYLVNSKPSSVNIIDGYEFVDLGLPSGLLWATCNVGAAEPHEYGKYFQWGATEGYYDGTEDLKIHSYWETCPFNNGWTDFNEYYFESVSGTVCPNGTLALQYDAARANMGGKWRMPSANDSYELYQYTTSGWTTVSGVNGVILTSKSNSSNSIFFPAASWYSYGSIGQNGIRTAGSVWLSSLLKGESAYDMLYNNWSAYPTSYMPRYYAYSVRGVIEP